MNHLATNSSVIGGSCHAAGMSSVNCQGSLQYSNHQSLIIIELVEIICRWLLAADSWMMVDG